jgi:hypothetical protein
MKKSRDPLLIGPGVRERLVARVEDAPQLEQCRKTIFDDLEGRLDLARRIPRVVHDRSAVHFEVLRRAVCSASVASHTDMTTGAVTFATRLGRATRQARAALQRAVADDR